MNTVNVSFRSNGRLVLPSGERSRTVCRVANRGTWRRILGSLGYQNQRVLNIDQMAIIVIQQRFIKLRITEKGVKSYDVFSDLLKTEGIEKIVKMFADYDQHFTYQQIIQEVEENYKCLKDSQMQLKMQPTQLEPPLMTVIKLTPKQPKQPKREPLLAL